jgi:uncharacterized protein YkwD
VEETQTGTKVAIIVGLIGLGLFMISAPPALVVAGGFVLVIGALYILLLPLMLLIMLFTGGGSPAFDPYDAAEQSIEAAQGNGKGTLDLDQLPVGLRDTVEDAGDECSQIGPVVIAAQIDVGSAWYAAYVGENGEVGISALPPEIFEEYGEDTDDNDETSAEDPEDSIMAQAKYMCDLAKKVQGLIDDGQAIGDPLDLTLAAYKVGFDAVKEAGGVPEEGPAREYLYTVRSYFAKYMGILGPPQELPKTGDDNADNGKKEDDEDEERDPAERAAQTEGDEEEDSPPASTSAQAGAVLSLVNDERSKAGCGAVSIDAKLTTAAQRHSEDQAEHDNMSHTGSDGSTVGDRLDRAGYSWSTYGENVAMGYTTPEAVMQGWMNSDGHRRNILNCDVTQMGLASAKKGDTLYWTQVFGAPR